MSSFGSWARPNAIRSGRAPLSRRPAAGPSLDLCINQSWNAIVAAPLTLTGMGIYRRGSHDLDATDSDCHRNHRERPSYGSSIAGRSLRGTRVLRVDAPCVHSRPRDHRRSMRTTAGNGRVPFVTVGAVAQRRAREALRRDSRFHQYGLADPLLLQSGWRQDRRPRLLGQA